LERFLENKTSKSNKKSDFVFLFGLAKKKFLTGTEKYASLAKTDEEGNLYSEPPEEDPETVFTSFDAGFS
jgi:hypothetical protein